MNTQKKIINLLKLRRILRSLRQRRKKVVFTNGCFDIIHPGHVAYLEKAKEKNSILIVGLNSDSSVRKIKGKTRPINSEFDRAKVLAGLESVDYVVIFNDTTPINLIKSIRPNVLAKGADWKGKVVVGEDFISSYGGKIKLVKYLEKYSTSKLLSRF